MTPRLTTQFWIDAYLLRLGQETIPVFITKKGDKTAGAILINLNLLDGTARLFHRSYDKDGARVWRGLTGRQRGGDKIRDYTANPHRPRSVGDRGGKQNRPAFIG